MLGRVVPLPPLFLERMSHFLGDEFDAFCASLEAKPASGLRLNTLKLSAGEFRALLSFPLGEAIPWCQAAWQLTESDHSLGLHPYHLAGLYYLQDPSAMAVAPSLEPQPNERVLDLTAAPGGKTTHLATLMQGRGLLVANEIKEKRIGHLIVNLERWGAGNVVVTNETPERLAEHFGAWFDRVLVDAPCSGEGMFRKDPIARRDWSPDMVEGCALRQTNILRTAAHLVRPGGRLLYSTCTFAPEENEGVLARFLQEHSDFEVEALSSFPGFERGRPEWLKMPLKPSLQQALQRAVRLFPHRVFGDGHFLCRLRRRSGEEATRLPDERLEKPNRIQYEQWAAFAAETLKIRWSEERLRVRAERLYLLPETMPDFGDLRLIMPGVWLGTFKKGRFEPAHALALFLRPDQMQRAIDLPVDSREIRAYLRGESLDGGNGRSWTVVTVNGWPLGWGKVVQGVLKNHYPRGWMSGGWA
ncbi:MAG: RsmF rRNA methyltransferase first C-terminal domain-containing protein [Anaerolineales bacterium]|nr:RsmF rRNA methyltransferase first C-terminal domain-containing protein [Anaerolineales bacterium]MCX7607620.1 RsmF rRNA methyltransferase first C-terminal domain-containing protein [Anaerolineales bacterium]